MMASALLPAPLTSLPAAKLMTHLLHTETEQGLTSHQTHCRSYRGGVFTDQMTQPTVSKHWRKIGQRIRLQSNQVHPYGCLQ